MTYPSFGLQLGSSYAVAAGAQIDTATNGDSRGRSFFTTPKRKWRVAHKLSDADLTTWLAYHAAHIATEDTFDWLGATYTVIFASDPQVRPLGAGWHEVAIDLIEG